MRLFFSILLLSFLCLGFRTYTSKNLWDVDNTSAARAKLFVVYDRATDVITNDLPSDDPLGSGTLTVQLIMNSIFHDYNNVQGAYIMLVSSSDSDFVNSGAGRTMTMSNASAAGVSAGQAQWEYVNGTLAGCRINITNSMYTGGARQFIRVVTHEIGHCLGLDHAQETVNSIMSYFSDSQTAYRLQDDDKMGLIFLFPTTPDKAKEAATFGASCSRR